MLLGLMDGGTKKARELMGNAWRDGCWAQHAFVPLENAIPLNEEVLMGNLGYDAADIAYLHRSAVAYGGVSTIGVKAGETVIVGPATGQFGGAAVEVASAVGARVIALGRNTAALAHLKATVPRVKAVTITGNIEEDT
ncbi:hypothetical protein F5Y15DRAFT_393070 [Xylariaceae sp. FL0016]|nr:hypothetical protein F5Y15DRAFT_393070 [Xylariaceae sp. FL0016]